MEKSIIVEKVTKKFGAATVLENVSMIANKGRITGLLGPNGAGKSTLIKIMTTLLKADSGSVTINGFDASSEAAGVRENIGLTGQFAAVDDFLTGKEMLVMVAQLYGSRHSEASARADELLKKLDLVEAKNKQIKTYSGGMRRRLDLGASLVVTPPILFLDEPTTGLDPRTRLQLWEIIRELVSQGVTILLTTQYLEEADALCDYIYLIDGGKMVLQGTTEELKNSLGDDVIDLKINTKKISLVQEEIEKVLKKKVEQDPATKKLKIKSTDGAEDLLSIASVLKRLGVKAEELSLHRPSLDEVFLSVTKKEKK
jgi:ABC-2 type transport system ATP-binding protein